MKEFSANSSLWEDQDSCNYQVPKKDRKRQMREELKIMKNKKCDEGKELFKSLYFIKQTKSSEFTFSMDKQEIDPDCIKYRFNKDNLLKIFFKNLQSCEIMYIKTEGQSQNYSQFYYYLRQQLKYHQKMKPQGQQIMKIRSYILREAMDQFCEHKLPKSNSKVRGDLKYKRRMNRQDIKRYEDSNLLVPPPRMKNQFINKLFQNEEFKQYYLNYVQTNKLKNYLEQKSIYSCQYFETYVFPLLNEKNGLQRVIKYLEGPNNSPLFYREIQFYLKQSYKIASYFIRQKKLPEKPKKQKKQLSESEFSSEQTQIHKLGNYRISQSIVI